MSKMKRLIEMMMYIQPGRKFTLSELATEFNISKRTVLRDLQQLEELGLPLYSEPGVHGGYKILKSKSLPPIIFTEDEAISMFFAYQTFEQYRDLPFKSEIISALKKYYYYLSDETRERIDKMKHHIKFYVPKHSRDTPYLNEILQSSINKQIIKIEYQGSKDSNSRLIQPIGIYSDKGIWYCPSYCFTKKNLRIFRVDRILNLEICHDQLTMMDYCEANIDNWYTHYSQFAKNVKLVVELSSNGVRRFEKEHWAINHIITKEDGSGVLETYISEQDIEYLSEYFLSFGLDVKVLYPIELVEKIKKNLYLLVKNYQ